MEVLYRDDHFLAVMKPAGLASVRERWTDAESALVAVWSILREDDAEARKPRVVHRLDKGTTGVLLFATSLAAARSLSRQFKERGVRKTYAALVLGTPPADEARIEVRLDEDRGRPGSMKVVEKRGKPSVTEVLVVERFRGYALLEVRPLTGRMHQIRVSLRHHGYPLLVDPTYGGHEALFLSELKRRYKRKKGQPERPLIDRVSLHAERIELDHPISGERVEIAAPIPKDLTLALKYLRKYRAL